MIIIIIYTCIWYSNNIANSTICTYFNRRLQVDEFYIFMN